MPQQRLRKQQKQQRETSKGNVLLLDFDETFWCTQKYNEHKLLYMAFNSVSFIRLPLWWSCSQNSVGGTNLIPISNSESDCKILELWWIKSNVLQHSICDETHSHTTPTAGNNKKNIERTFYDKRVKFWFSKRQTSNCLEAKSFILLLLSTIFRHPFNSIQVNEFS